MSCVQEVRMKTVKELLEEMSREVNQLTDLSKKYKVNVKGQRVEGIKIINAFDEDIRDFISSSQERQPLIKDTSTAHVPPTPSLVLRAELGQEARR
jgi:hypothetical protein